LEKEFLKHDEIPKINEADMISMINNIESFLGQYLGETKNPLAYIIREDPNVTPEADDPPTNYSTKQAEMITRAPHQQGANSHPYSLKITTRFGLFLLISVTTPVPGAGSGAMNAPKMAEVPSSN
jgi:hypothetical protein